MIWQDLLFDRWVDDAALRAAMASAFGVPLANVALVDSAEQLASTSRSARVILERTRQHRDFPLQMLVVLRSDDLARRSTGFEEVLRVARVLAAGLSTTVLFAEGPVTPSEWVRVRPGGETDVASLDVGDSGDVDSFFVVGARDLTVDGRVTGSGAARRTA
jgi:hypothetical protein